MWSSVCRATAPASEPATSIGSTNTLTEGEGKIYLCFFFPATMVSEETPLQTCDEEKPDYFCPPLCSHALIPSSHPLPFVMDLTAVPETRGNNLRGSADTFSVHQLHFECSEIRLTLLGRGPRSACARSIFQHVVYHHEHPYRGKYDKHLPRKACTESI